MAFAIGKNLQGDEGGQGEGAEIRRTSHGWDAAPTSKPTAAVMYMYPNCLHALPPPLGRFLQTRIKMQPRPLLFTKSGRNGFLFLLAMVVG